MSTPFKLMRAPELASYLAAGHKPVLLDVREAWEWNICHLPDSLLMPLRELPTRVASLDKQAEIVLICHHGVRSFHAAHYLVSLGFERVINLSGGVAAWADEVDSTMPRY
jgi:rhodanese-related sulfurtransferase